MIINSNTKCNLIKAQLTTRLLARYPVKIQGGARRSFQTAWYEQHQWIKDNRHYISAVVNALEFTAIHRLAQRGHDETRESGNAGKFIDLMKRIRQYNDTVGKKLTD